MNNVLNKISLVSTFLFEQTLHIFGVSEIWFLPSITDSFVDISNYSILHKDTSCQVAKQGVCIHIRRDIEFEFIMVDCQNVVCVRLVKLGDFVIMVYRPSLNSSDDNNHLSQVILNISVDR